MTTTFDCPRCDLPRSLGYGESGPICRCAEIKQQDEDDQIDFLWPIVKNQIAAQLQTRRNSLGWEFRRFLELIKPRKDTKLIEVFVMIEKSSFPKR